MFGHAVLDHCVSRTTTRPHQVFLSTALEHNCLTTFAWVFAAQARMTTTENRGGLEFQLSKHRIKFVKHGALTTFFCLDIIVRWPLCFGWTCVSPSSSVSLAKLAEGLLAQVFRAPRGMLCFVILLLTCEHNVMLGLRGLPSDQS